MARLADDSGTGTRRTVPTPRTTTPTTPSSTRAADETRPTPTAAATESPALQNQPSRVLTVAERAAQLKAEREAAYRSAQAAAMGEKPTPPPADEQYTYDYVWRQDVGGPGGKWTLVRYPKASTGTAAGAGGGTAGAGGAGGAGAGGAGSTGGAGGAGGTGGAGTTTTSTTTTPTGLTAKQLASQSAFEVFRGFLRQYGLEALAPDIEKYKLDGLSDDELLMRLRTESRAYKRRFQANETRIAKGLRALDEATYIGLEDQYQEVMRRYGLPQSYYARGEMGRQEGFEKFIAGDVSPTEVEDRILTAQNRILYANPEVGIALKTFYPDISNGDLLAYALDPEQALAQIKRRITAAEIGATAVQLGLATNVTDAEYLARYGVTKAQAQTGFRNVAETLPRASQLGDIYAKQGMGPYTQATATQEFFNVPGAAEAAAKRRKLAELEIAQFSGQSGMTGGALARERAGQF